MGGGGGGRGGGWERKELLCRVNILEPNVHLNASKHN